MIYFYYFYYYGFRTHEMGGHLANIFYQVERNFHNWQSNSQPLHVVLGTSPLLFDSLWSSWTLVLTISRELSICAQSTIKWNVVIT